MRHVVCIVNCSAFRYFKFSVVYVRNGMRCHVVFWPCRCLCHMTSRSKLLNSHYCAKRHESMFNNFPCFTLWWTLSSSCLFFLDNYLFICWVRTFSSFVYNLLSFLEKIMAHLTFTLEYVLSFIVNDMPLAFQKMWLSL